MRFFLRAVSLLLFGAWANFAAGQSVTVLDPNGGETLGGCTTYTIRWDAQNTSGYFSIDFSTDNAVNWTSVASGLYLPGNGTKTFAWSVPNVNSGLCRVRVVDTYASGVRDSSNAVFTITEAMRLLVPNGGEIWPGLSSQSVAWNNNSSSTNWLLQYSTNSGVSWSTINSNYNSPSGNYNWTVNHTPSTTCKFRVTSTSNSCITDQTDGLFTISEVPPVLTTPNGGESWWSLDPYYIYWNQNSVLSSTVRLEYSTDNGSTWNLITPNAPNSGNYYWTLPFAPSTQALVRLNETINTNRKDTSDAVFTIRNPVIVGTPNGGQNYNGCTNVTISGTKASALYQVKVEYSSNNGSTWSLIGTTSSSASNSWAIAWTTPAVTSSQYLIRASNPSNSAMFDVSDAPFTVTSTNQLTLQSPNGGQVWTSLNTYPINWFAGPLVPSSLSISYSTNNGSSWNTIASSVNTALGTYNWTPPNLSSNQVLIRLQANACHTDESDAVFTINPVKTLLTTPNGGEQWYATDPYYIYWNSQTLLGSSNVRLEYSTNSGTNWNVVVGSTNGSSGNFYWTIPNTPSTTSLVRILELNDTTRKDTSDAVFTIRPVVTVTTPNGGQNFYGCNNVTISGNKASNLYQVRVEYTTNNGASWNLIGTTSSSGSNSWAIAWSIPNLTSSQCRIRASHPSNPLVFDESDANFTINPTNELTITTPNGGEVWTSLSSYQITWTAGPAVPSSLSLSYSTNNGASWNSIVSSTSTSTGFYNWTPPNINSSQCLVRAQSGSCHVDQSDAVFTINPVKPILTVPNGGDQWYATDPYYIYWNNQTLLSSTVRLEYSTNNGSNWTVIIGSTSGSSSNYYWTIPNTPSTTALVRLLELSDTTRKDTSDAVFTIRPVVSVNTPNGGQTYYGCNNVTISGNKASNLYQVRVEYTTNNGASWNLIGTTSSSGSNSWAIAWSIPNLTSSQCRIRASNPSNSLVFDESDANFTINPTNELTITTPNGGEVWTSLSPYQITWTAGPAVPSSLSLSYSTNNGTSWNSIVSSTSTSAGFYNWTPPNINSSQCLVRAQSGSCHVDQSDAVFTINPVKPILTVPNGGEQWYATDPYYIYWNTQTLLSSTVRLEYSTNNGTNWNVIVNSATSGNYYWTVPFTPTNQALVRLLEISDTTRKDTSDAVFTIRNPVNVGTPNGGQSYNGCTAVTVSGTKASNIYQVKVEYSSDNGSTWNLIGTTSSSGSNSWAISWTTPSVTSNQYLIRASNPSNGAMVDVSDATFTVTSSNQLTLQSPNGGQVWTSLNTYPINWFAGPLVPSSISISYSTNNGTSWNTIASSVNTALGTYSWTPPNLNSNQVLIRLQANACHNDVSDAVFTINPVKTLLTVPNGGEQWYATDPYYIYWDNQTLLGSSNVRLEYSTNSGTNWNVVVGSTNGSSGNFYWTVPNTPSTTSLVRILELSDTTRKDTSDAFFTIRPVVTVNTPNGGQTFYGCNTVTISGNKASNLYQVRVEYTTNNGATWNLIGTTSSSGSNSWAISWTIPNLTSTNCRVRASNPSNATVFDESNANFTINPTNELTIISPNGGEVWTSLNTYQIQWLAGPAVPSTLSLSYSTNNGSSWNSVVSSTSTAAGFYNWTPPNINSTNCLIRAQSGSCHVDQSDSVFTINPVKPLLTTPNGGETWYGGQGQYIYWAANTILNSSNVRLEYSLDNGSNWNVIIGSTSGTSGNYYWTVPNVNSTQALVRLIEISNTTRMDTSDMVFTIRPAITVVSPNGNTGNENFRGCTITSLTWNHSPDVTRFNLQYTTNNGTTWTTIVSNYYAPGTSSTYNWTIPNTPTGQARVRVQDYYSTVPSDESDNLFSITQPVILTQPTYGGVLQAGSVHNITWVSDGISNYYNLDYSTNGGTTWINIVTNYNTSTYVYAWTVPNTPSANCRVRVTDYLNSCKWDISDATFSINNLPPSITITAPNGYDTTAACASRLITWNATGTSGNYNISYSTNAGATWTPIVSNYAAPTNSYTWTYGNLTSNFMLIRVQDAADPNKVDQSDAAFALTQVSLTASNDTSVCAGVPVQLNVNGGGSYVWSPATGLSNPNIANPDATPAVTTLYTVTSQVGTCTLTETVEVEVVSKPSITFSGSNIICQGDTLLLTSSEVSGNLWSNGSVNNAIEVTNSGDYSVTTTTGGCTLTSDTLSVSVIAPNTPTVSASGPLTFCDGESVQLTSSLPTGIIWSNGSTATDITVNTSGTYYVSENNACGTSSATVTVTVNPLPTQPVISASGPLNICVGDTVILVSSVPTGNTWSNGATTPTVKAWQTAVYTVSQTNGFGCTSTSNPVTVVVNANSNPSVTALGTTTFCQGDSVVLASNLSQNLIWSTGDTTPNLVVKQAGSYQVFDQTGCGGSSNVVNVTVNPAPATPVITPSGSTQLCVGSQVTLNSSAASNYVWNTGATTQSINVGTGGTYTVTVTGGNGCTSVSSPISVVVNTPTPASITAGGPTTFCQGGTVSLAASPGASFLWSNGATTQAINANTSGSFTVTVTDVNGCTATSNSQAVVVNAAPAAPTVTAGGPLTLCGGSTVTLSSSYAGGNLWSNGATTQNITVNTSGTFQVTHTDGNGCSSTSAPVTVNVSSAPATPTISPNGPTSFCQGDSVVLTAPTSAGYLWSNGATTQSITVLNTGNFTVTVSNGAGCTASSAATSVTVNAIPSTPTVSASGPTTFCTGGSVTLTAPTAGAYLWSNGATTQTITVSNTGNFAVTVSNGVCQAASAPVAVTVSTVPATPSISANGPTSFCQGDSVILTAPTSAGYLWSNGATTQSITVLNTGNFTVTVSNGAGCTASSAATSVTVNAIPSTPTVTASGPTTFCTGGNVTLTAPTAGAYLWSNGATTQSITVSNTGNFAVTVSNGVCQAVSAPVSVTVNSVPATPSVTASGPTTFCQGSSVVLTAPTSSSYLWSNGATTQSITVTNAGNYSVTVSNGSGCSAVSSATAVTVNGLPSTPSVSASGPTTFCAGGSVTLTASTATAYLWSNGATTQSITVSTAGNYAVTVSNGAGCEAASSPTAVTVNAAPAVPSVTASGPTTFCAGGSVTLTATTANSYVWSTGATTQSISVSTAGSYTVTVSNAGGCTATSTVTTVTVNPAPTANITASGATVFCQGGSVNLIASPGSSFLWSSGATTQSLLATASGSFTVTVTDVNGCSAVSNSQSVVVNPLPAAPTVASSGPLSFCQGGTVSLTSSYGAGNTWSPTNATTQSITVNTSGNYFVTHTDANGCSSASATVTVTVTSGATTPNITTSGATTFCQGDSVVLTSSASTGYAWSNGATSQSITVANTGTYTVTITDAGGCSASSTPVSVTVNPAPATPTIIVGGPLDICDGESVTLTSSSSVDNIWTPTASTSQSIQATTAGNYVVTVTNAFGCSAQSAPVTVNVLALPAVPVISQAGADLVSTTATSYQWYLNGAIIPGATSQTYSPTVTGSYTVVVTNANGCENTSAPFNYVFVGVAEAGSGDALQIFPNPSNGLFTIELELGSTTSADIQVVTMEGQVVWQYRMKDHVGLFRKQVDLTTLSRGVYLLQIRTDSGKEFVERIVTQ